MKKIVLEKLYAIKGKIGENDFEGIGRAKAFRERTGVYLLDFGDAFLTNPLFHDGRGTEGRVQDVTFVLPKPTGRYFKPTEVAHFVPENEKPDLLI